MGGVVAAPTSAQQLQHRVACFASAAAAADEQIRSTSDEPHHRPRGVGGVRESCDARSGFPLLCAPDKSQRPAPCVARRQPAHRAAGGGRDGAVAGRASQDGQDRGNPTRPHPSPRRAHRKWPAGPGARGTCSPRPRESPRRLPLSVRPLLPCCVAATWTTVTPVHMP